MRLPATPALAGVLLGACLLSAGCATPQLAALSSQLPATTPERGELAAVPFYPQEDYQCGPAALATTLAYAGIATSPEALVPQVFLPAREGSLQVEMLAAVRRHGRTAYRLAPRLADQRRDFIAAQGIDAGARCGGIDAELLQPDAHVVAVEEAPDLGALGAGGDLVRGHDSRQRWHGQ